MRSHAKLQRRNVLETYLRLSYRLAKKALPQYSHKFSRKTFTLPQVMSCLLLREYLRLDLRALEELLASNPRFVKLLGLKAIPDHSTFCRHLSKTSQDTITKLLDKTVRLMPAKDAERLAAIDSTGVSSSHASLYYLSKTRKKLKGFAKLSCIAAMSSLWILAARAHAGPGPNDRKDFLPLVAKAHSYTKFNMVVADKGYDSEFIHEWCRNVYKVKAIIPTILPKERVRTGLYRLEMARRFPAKLYRQRYKIEGVFSAMKRKFGGSVKARSRDNQIKEALLKTVAYNLRW